MPNSIQTQRTILNSVQDAYLLTWIDAFLVDRKARGTAKGSLKFYSRNLKLFTDFCENQAVKTITQIDPNLIRQFLLWLETTNHNPGGIHGAYRSLRAFLFWWEDEVEPEGWKNPIRKVKAPKVPIEPIDPVELDTVKALI
ncbi:MAG TPA: phage integrase N-terminal SAM-like domain-containing protein [Anaerolineaceae bacterium]|nr:phage integrase N-terminal SAM-like domain-containing protein [Anaerolineaceae bacterium]